MSRKHKKKEEHQEEVQLGKIITPMLDMTFQLLAFFIFTFKPTPQEGQLAMYLPKEESSATSTDIPRAEDIPTQNKEFKLEVRGAGGDIEFIQLFEPGDTSGSIIKGNREDILKNLYQVLKKIIDSPEFAKLPLDKRPTMKVMASKDLRYSEFMRVTDACIKAGFSSVGPGLAR